MIEVRVRGNEPIEKAIRRFKKKYEKAGILKDVKKNMHYVKPSTQRRIQHAKSIKRLRLLKKKRQRRR